MKILKHYILTALFIFVSSITFAQIKFEAKVSKSTLGVNERLRIDFIMNEDGDNFTSPDFNGFTVIAGPNIQQSREWRNGIKSYKKIYSYFLAPKKRGTFIIKQATIEIKGEIYKTATIKVEVTAAVDIPKDPNDPNYIASKNIHLVAEVSNGNPYLNEAITVVHKLYVSPNVGIEGSRDVDIPRYNDFWNQNIDVSNERFQNGTFKGEDYRYLIINKVVLYPQKSGKLKIEPYAIDIALRVPTNRRDIFGSRIMARVNRTVTSGSRTIKVKALPEEGKPIDFTGAVGSFDLDVSASKTELDATESLQLKVNVKGNGNLKLFKLPKLSLPSSLEVYEPEHGEKVRTNLSGMSGSISDSYTIVPQYKGKYPIPSISFSYFDLKTKTYKRLASEEIVINVLNGPASAASATEGNGNVPNNKQAVVLNSDQFSFIKTKSAFQSMRPAYFFKTNLFWSLLLLPFLAIPIAIFIRNKKAIRDADVHGNRIRKADRLAKKYLSNAKKSLGKKEAFYIALEKALHNYLKAKLHIETSDFSKDRITSLLKEKQVEDHVINGFIGILENCELARYTPIDNVTMQEDYDKAAKTISLIDKQAR